ncbi:hypothetical protein AruPA_05925 [Acidiphilium sp. PA]|uniref:hypothetical protein n=1 Tax=Acidiphilium sp. PA TaxID=2871705 RepID=UPI0022443DEB|nr:hypothetical protein [Acidiphilium sp. PA]MCW8306568.1 hypothetical protein [Acidiphilium sp. PA]
MEIQIFGTLQPPPGCDEHMLEMVRYPPSIGLTNTNLRRGRLQSVERAPQCGVRWDVQFDAGFLLLTHLALPDPIAIMVRPRHRQDIARPLRA